MNLPFRTLVLTCVMIFSCDYDIADIFRPEIDIINPTAGGYYNADTYLTFSVIFSASDDAGLDKYKILIDGSNEIAERGLGEKKVIEEMRHQLYFEDLNIYRYQRQAYVTATFPLELKLVVYDINGNFSSKTVKFFAQCGRCGPAT